MEVASNLNPNAPLYVPWAYRAVEDFSEQWWELVKVSPCFRDYWLQECFEEGAGEAESLDDLDEDALFHGYQAPGEEEEGKAQKGARELAVWGAEKWRARRGAAEERVRHAAKAPKIVSVRVSPRQIKQPR